MRTNVKFVLQVGCVMIVLSLINRSWFATSTKEADLFVFLSVGVIGFALERWWLEQKWPKIVENEIKRILSASK